ncbi:MAG: hypothetical protein REH83_03740, partial [Rickettsiella sp.]|nr:hypothetical protein [Rickettsiella sp.]
FNVFRNIILENILFENLKKAPPLEKLNLNFFKFLEFINRANLTFSDFRNFLNQQTYQGLAAINLLLAHPLRMIGTLQYLKIIRQDFFLLKDDETLLENGAWIGDDILSSLAQYFGITIRLIGNYGTLETPLREEATPLFSLLNQENHWHYLLPKNQNDGLAKVFPFSKNTYLPIQQSASQNFLKINNQLLKEIKKDYLETKIIFTETNLSSLAIKLKNIFHYLKKIFSGTSNINEIKIADIQANTAAKNSTEILNKLRSSWERDSDELDNRLSILGLKNIEKTLIKKPFITDNSADAAQATLLQNAEIADFFSRNYTKLNFFTNIPHTKIQSPKTTLPAMLCI